MYGLRIRVWQALYLCLRKTSDFPGTSRSYHYSSSCHVGWVKLTSTSQFSSYSNSASGNKTTTLNSCEMQRGTGWHPKAASLDQMFPHSDILLSPKWVMNSREGKGPASEMRVFTAWLWVSDLSWSTEKAWQKLHLLGRLLSLVAPFFKSVPLYKITYLLSHLSFTGAFHSEPYQRWDY